MTPGQWLLDFFWTNDDLLEASNKWGGVLMAITGAMIVAPQACKHALGATVGVAITKISMGIRSALARRHGGTLSQVTAVRSISFDSHFGAATATQSLRFEEKATVAEKVTWLKNQLEFIDARWQNAAARLDEIDQMTRRQLQELDTGVHAELKELRDQVGRIERDSVQIDATGLPPILAGIILTGVPEELAGWGVFGWMIFLIFAGGTIAAASRSYSSGNWR
ncbi:hypothetical protein CQ020_03635 [Arthrobacter sp. MYb23]|uniref:hypothetical protein n=1 Tax=unclassified Arthrobacter TaxID=235627 RepID=UPI000CFE0CBF|nr:MULTISPECIES: hypothetical protein [unclassified Arthrobacter]PRB44312.1 hypothetical protein CQ038_03490 [Arthrobacter sp. MYb51]PRB98564.1 hypothetical protein CQ020_03635 [Arthrobacter sp. MYb23]